MTTDSIFRLIGMVLFAVLGAGLGADSASTFRLNPEVASFLSGIAGIFLGFILSHWMIIRPVRALWHSMSEWSDERLWMSLLGLFVALIFALLMTYPLSLLEPPIGRYLPAGIVIFSSYLGISVFGPRAMKMPEAFRAGASWQINRAIGSALRELILDTSVLIDGRITDIASTGVLGGNLIVPEFVLNELHRVADSSEPLRRTRGERGIEMLNKLQRDDKIYIKIVGEDFDNVQAVDDKLVALARQRRAAIITNDFNLNKVAEAQGVSVLNINRLANAVRLIYLPGESFEIQGFLQMYNRIWLIFTRILLT